MFEAPSSMHVQLSTATARCHSFASKLVLHVQFFTRCASPPLVPHLRSSASAAAARDLPFGFFRRTLPAGTALAWFMAAIMSASLIMPGLPAAHTQL